jgi:hypothetical protein
MLEKQSLPTRLFAALESASGTYSSFLFGTWVVSALHQGLPLHQLRPLILGCAQGMLQLFVGLAILRRIRGALFLIIVVCGWHIITLSRTMLTAGITRTPLLILLYQGIFVVWLTARRHELIRKKT